jgi:uncharacterized repeat protein (TIGR03803 family)
MTSTAQHQGRISRIPLRAARGALALAIVLVPAVLATRSVQAQTYTVLYSFNSYSTDGQSPYAGLVRDAVGNLYGTTSEGGTSGSGVVFKLDTTGNETVLYSFTGGDDGANPYAGLIRDGAGNLYGTAVYGGALGEGVVFKLHTTGKETALYSFTGGADGANPYAGLVRDAAGNLYGTASAGGSSACSEGCGVVFKVDTTGKEIVLHTFAGFPTDGEFPYGGLVRDSAGNLYGTTYSGGAFDGGVVFRLDATGKETLLYTFTGGADGGNPYAGLVRDRAGNLYGTTITGGSGRCGAEGCGVVFKLATTGKEKVLYSFARGADGVNPNPYGGLVRDAAGNLYGTTVGGGAFGSGDVFKLDTTGKKTALYTFTGGADGANPYGGLIRDSAGNLYGTTLSGGGAVCLPGYFCPAGALFMLTP